MAATPYDVSGARASGLRSALVRLRSVRLGPFGGVLGLLVVAGGLLVIGIGWNGVAGSGGQVNGFPDIRAQLPYLLSGGFLGLGIVVLGAAMVVVTAHREDRARLEGKLDELVEALGRERSTGVAPSTLLAPGAGVATLADDVVVTGAASYHRPDCRLVQGRDHADYVTADVAAGRGLSPCRVCKPA